MYDYEVMQSSESKTNPSPSTFISIANEEYDTLVNYCNSLSKLTHAAYGQKDDKVQRERKKKNEQEIVGVVGGSDVDDNNNNNGVANDIGSIEMKRKNIMCLDPNDFLPSPQSSGYRKTQEDMIYSNALQEYQTCLEQLRTQHSKLIHCQNKLSESMEECNDLEMMTKHLELSSRVLKTCASSMKRGYGPFYENGILKNIGGGLNQSVESDVMEDWYEIRIVALTSYRASVARLKNHLEE